MNFYQEKQQLSLDHFRDLVELMVEYAKYRYDQGENGFGVVNEVHHVGNVYSLYVHHRISGTNAIAISAVSGSCASPDRVYDDLRDLQKVIDEVSLDAEVVEQSWEDALKNAYLLSSDSVMELYHRMVTIERQIHQESPGSANRRFNISIARQSLEYMLTEDQMDTVWDIVTAKETDESW